MRLILEGEDLELMDKYPIIPPPHPHAHAQEHWAVWTMTSPVKGSRFMDVSLALKQSHGGVKCAMFCRPCHMRGLRSDALQDTAEKNP